MSFKKNKYTVLKQAISPELAKFVYKYFLNKREVAKFLFEEILCYFGRCPGQQKR